MVKNLPANAGDTRDAWIGKIPWRRKWQLTPVFFPGKSHEQSSLADYSPWGHRVRHNWAYTHTHTNTGCEFLINWKLVLKVWVDFRLNIILVHLHAKSLQLCPTLCDPMDCSPPCSSVHGISQATILELGCSNKNPVDWVAYKQQNFLTDLEAGSLRSGCPRGWVGAPFWVAVGLLVPYMAEGAVNSEGSLL